MNLGKALGMPEDVWKYKPDNNLVLPTCRLGLEFEFEGVSAKAAHPKDAWSAYWTQHRDGSLHDNGLEFVFSEPLWGLDATDAIRALCKWAIAHKFKTSIRTGLHVHVDVRDLNRMELARLNVIYALFERAVYRFAGNNREENVFCLPWYKSDHMAAHVNTISSDTTDIRVASEALAQEKYGGLNLDTLARFGSVEFRHALSTTDVAWVMRWVNVCLSFKRAAQKLDATPVQLIHNLSAVGVEQFARQVFEDQFDELWYVGLDTDVWAYGVETAMAVFPRHQPIIDAASLSWNTKKQIPEESINPSFKAFIANIKPTNKEKSAKLDEVAERARPAFLDFEVRPLLHEPWVGQAGPVDPEPEF